ncbi:hypothetical protein [Paenibacillus dendritiformis]|uniref:hypothetical protein n=1 Tax=Paenibacillus dendritiformis TaxID=130049 RepID=UPI0020C1F6D4|nr:hypothetical protein [Paenibacillus dendritiformis]CAH8768971.1 hypothetical protein H7S4_001669 [Paenibacillus dendritiformis]
MTCKQPELTAGKMDVAYPFQEVASAEPGSRRRLMLSDNPEVLDAGSFPEAGGTLWHDVVQSDADQVKHRVMGWHINQTGQPLQVGLTLENQAEANTLQIRQIKREARIVDASSNILVEAGQCLAASCLAGTMDDHAAADCRPLAQEVGLIEAREVPHGHLIGFIYEFTVCRSSGDGPLHYVVRTAASRSADTDLRTIVSEPLSAAGQPHPRGSWPFSETLALMPEYEVGGTTHNYRALAKSRQFGGSPPADLLFTAGSSDPLSGSGAVNNIAQFGAIYTVSLPIRNETGAPAKVHIWVNPRGGKYAGAVRLGKEVFRIPALPTNKDACQIAEYEAPEGLSTFTFSLMTAGESNTPLGIFVTTSS